MSIIKKSELERTQRVDAEFYSKENLNVISSISKLNAKPVSDFFRVSDGNHMTISDQFSQDGIPYYRGGDIYNFFIENTAQPLTIPESIYNWPNLKRSHLQKGDVLVSIVGAIIGNLSLVTTNQKATCSCKLAILRPTNIKPQFAAIYFKTKFGQNQIQKFRRGSGQTGLILEDFDQLLIPEISENFAEVIVNFVEQAHQKLELSILAYQQAETFLFESIGLQDFQPSSEAVNIKSFKNSFGTSGRLDAEYYQKKYEDYISLVQKYPNGWQRLNNACTLKDSNFNPNEKTSYKYIELSDIGKTGDITGCTTAFGSDLPSRARRVVNTGDVVISSIEGSLGSCAMVLAEYNNALCSTGFYVINSSKINAATLLVLFKSEVMQNILKQGCSGTILTAINKNEFLNMPVPLFEQNIQNQVAVSIEESFRLKKQSEHLLEVAKKAVEMAIEDGEERAMEWIAANTGRGLDVSR